MRVIIAGLGNVGTDLAELLIREGSHRLVLIDEDHELCQQAANKYDALVLEGDGTEPEVLRQAQVGEADVLVASTDSDALNTVIAMLGKQFKVPKIIVKLVDIGLRPACQEIGVDAIVSPNLSTANEIRAIIHGYGRLDFSYVVSKGARLAEFTLDNDQANRLVDLSLPQGSLVVSIIRQDKAIVPYGKTTYKERDTLVVIAQDDKTMEKVQEIFKKPEEESPQD